MLEELLALKRRREGRLRRQIAAGNQRYQRLINCRQALEQERAERQKAWRQLGEEGRGKLAKERLHNLQRQLEAYFQRDKALESEIMQTEAECQQWLQEKQRLQQLFQQNRIDQEKLRYVLDEGLDAHS
ncbi:hypothetical protein MUA02_01210 [Enterobacteriaceae bacterium H20N1]|uniref:Uncharacterized protein n=1 Tax=Dryocola boscaweniae TaxID=2925397 RepID=A0A9X2W403_9ENTR|nr:hypothetical protein [Dryocola boscaweniae]MCT4700526.1 hypothetical protein [Dryocola boscaweniae]MCT4717682.1 hypothetical protein [Dryocola boscaweniae]